MQILDRDQLPMFPVGSDAMYPHTRRLLEVVAQAIAGCPTGSRCAVTPIRCRSPPAPATDNWRPLGRPCQRHARLAMIEAGLDPGAIAEVVGKADAEPLIADRSGRSAQPADLGGPAARATEHRRTAPGPGGAIDGTEPPGLTVADRADRSGDGEWTRPCRDPGRP